MTTIFGVPAAALYGQLLIGLINGSFYALLSLGLAVIFGLLQVINFAHGALYMLGAFTAWLGLQYFGINYWASLIVALTGLVRLTKYVSSGSNMSSSNTRTVISAEI